MSAIRSLSEGKQTSGGLSNSVENDRAVIGLRNSLKGIYGMCLTLSVDLQLERFDDRRPQSNIGRKRLPEFFRV